MVLELETETSFRAWTDSDELTPTDLAACSDPVRGRSNKDTAQYGEREGAEPKLGRLDVQRIEKSLAGRAILTNVSLYVQRGEVVTLFGPIGAGRSTLFDIVTGLVPADAGQIELDGQGISRLPMYLRARLGLAYVPQELPIYGSGLNSAQNFEFAARRPGDDNERLATGTEAILEKSDLGHLRKKISDQLSGDERRWVEIARAIATRPGYLLLDEPFMNVEPAKLDALLTLIQLASQQGIGVLVAHQLNQHARRIRDVSDRAYLISAGQILGTLGG
jgi:lipopolysaccharide export system ATP-binding protein